MVKHFLGNGGRSCIELVAIPVLETFELDLGKKIKLEDHLNHMTSRRPHWYTKDPLCNGICNGQ